MAILCMADDDRHVVVENARVLYASAVKVHRGRYQARIDKGTRKKTKEGSEATWLKKRKASVAEACATAGPDDIQPPPPSCGPVEKELQLQKRRRLDRAIEAATAGLLIPEDAGQRPFDEVAKKKKTSARETRLKSDEKCCGEKHSPAHQYMQKDTVELESIGASKGMD